MLCSDKDRNLSVVLGKMETSGSVQRSVSAERQRSEIIVGRDDGVWCGRIICILSIMYFNKTLIGQAGSIGRSTRQEVEAGR